MIAFCLFFSGVYAAAHDFKTEWVVVKGIKDFADEMQSSSKKWKQIACVMAASVVAKIGALCQTTISGKRGA